MKHLRVVLILIVLLLGIAGAAILTANAGAPARGNALTPRIYLPLVARSGSTPTPGTWITVLEEGFEAAPSPLWQFRDDNGAIGGAYQWGRRDCQPATGGSYSAWAVGGGADGELLPCPSTYPDNVQTTMLYGPFSLADAKMAQMQLRAAVRSDLAEGRFLLVCNRRSTAIQRYGGGRFMPQRPAVRVDDAGPRPG